MLTRRRRLPSTLEPEPLAVVAFRRFPSAIARTIRTRLAADFSKFTSITAWKWILAEMYERLKAAGRSIHTVAGPSATGRDNPGFVGRHTRSTNLAVAKEFGVVGNIGLH